MNLWTEAMLAGMLIFPFFRLTRSFEGNKLINNKLSTMSWWATALFFMAKMFALYNSMSEELIGDKILLTFTLLMFLWVLFILSGILFVALLEKTGLYSKIVSWVILNFNYQKITKPYSKTYQKKMNTLIKLLYVREVFLKTTDAPNTHQEVYYVPGRYTTNSYDLYESLALFFSKHTYKWNKKDYTAAIVEETLAQPDAVTLMTYLHTVLNSEKLTRFLFTDDSAVDERRYIRESIEAITKEINHKTTQYQKTEDLGNQLDILSQLVNLRQNTFTTLTEIKINTEKGEKSMKNNQSQETTNQKETLYRLTTHDVDSYLEELDVSGIDKQKLYDKVTKTFDAMEQLKIFIDIYMDSEPLQEEWNQQHFKSGDSK